LALADRIEWLAEHPQDVERVGHAAARLIQEQYTWEHYAQGVSAIYRELSGVLPDHDAKR
jgi:glycosyltransferase involved in cell wall biosynthesis